MSESDFPYFNRDPLQTPANAERASFESTEKELDDEPQFGLIDVIEAFTAMRQQWRTQSKESRQLSDSINESAQRLLKLESSIDEKLASINSHDPVKRLLELVIDLDLSLDRAVVAMESHAATKLARQSELVEQIRDLQRQSGWLTRWSAQKHFDAVNEVIQNSFSSETNTADEGVAIVLSRLRRMMNERGLKRVEVVGELFDAETMNAISSISTGKFAPGYVAEQISPAYFFQGQLLRFAEVRVEKRNDL